LTCPQDKKFVVVSIGEAMAEERELADLYSYDISDLVHTLASDANVRKAELSSVDLTGLTKVGARVCVCVVVVVVTLTTETKTSSTTSRSAIAACCRAR
jgi:hypothetical protein